MIKKWRYLRRFIIFGVLIRDVDRNSALGIATRNRLEGPEIESDGGEIFRTQPECPWGPPSLLYSRHRVFPGVKAAGAWR
jgi:hypothetical protein